MRACLANLLLLPLVLSSERNLANYLYRSSLRGKNQIKSFSSALSIRRNGRDKVGKLRERVWREWMWRAAARRRGGSVLSGFRAGVVHGQGPTQIYIASNNMRDTGVLIRLATLRHTQGWVSFRTYCLLMASLHQHHRGVQHHPLEPPCVSSPFTILHV